MSRVVLFLLRLYKLTLSPVLPGVCMYSPSCADFAAAAYRRHGFWHGTRLTVARLWRCWPWAHGGYDPVP